MKKHQDCQHVWEYRADGYSFCKFCGCASDHHRCVTCKTEYLGFKILFTENEDLKTIMAHFCSRKCLLKYIIRPSLSKLDKLVVSNFFESLYKTFEADLKNPKIKENGSEIKS
jgi:hypothetical protein